MAHSKIYTATLHVLLIALAALSLQLMAQNRALKNPTIPEPPKLEVGQTVASQPVLGLDGGTESLGSNPEDPRDRVLLVYTTTCPACRENQQAWKSLYAEAGDRADIVGISLDGLEAARAYRDKHALPFPVRVPSDRDAFAQAFEVSAVPLTVHLSASGEVRGTWLGALGPDDLAALTASVSG